MISYLLNKLNAGLEVQTKVYENPVNALSFVLLLLQHEHVMVEELLQLFVGEIDAKLLKTIELSGRSKKHSQLGQGTKGRCCCCCWCLCSPCDPRRLAKGT